MSEAEVTAAEQAASKKLEWIIARYGDEGGERKKPEYFRQLVSEELRAQRLRNTLNARYEEKRGSPAHKARSNPPKASSI